MGSFSVGAFGLVAGLGSEEAQQFIEGFEREGIVQAVGAGRYVLTDMGEVIALTLREFGEELG